jgi:hypothetical protein
MTRELEDKMKKLIESAYMAGCCSVERTSEWKVNGYYDGDVESSNSPDFTVFWWETDEDGIDWVYAQDCFPEGCIETCAARIGML